jgi:hypothetical protein
MTKRSVLSTTLAVAVLTLTALPGCRRGVQRVPLIPVSGKILWQNKPVGGAHVLLVPIGQETKEISLSRGTTGSDGTFRLTTYAPEDGVPAGEYAVSLTWKGPTRTSASLKGSGERSPMGAGLPDYFRNRYKDPKTSGLRLKIEPGATELSPINLR